MTTLEFSDLFDLLYNNISSNQAPGLDEYEKSVFLTKALDEIIKSYFNPKLNKLQEGFDGSERRLIDFSNIIKVWKLARTAKIEVSIKTLTVVNNTKLPVIIESTYINDGESTINSLVEVSTTGIKLKFTYHGNSLFGNSTFSNINSKGLVHLSLENSSDNIDSSMWKNVFGTSYLIEFPLKEASFVPQKNSTSIDLPSEILLILNEQTFITRDSKSLILLTIPLKYTEYTRLMSKPYKRPTKWLAWRILNYNSSNSADIVVGNMDTIIGYELRYVKRPNPIILSTLEGVSIGNKTAVTECELDPILHEEILQRAVELAKAAWQGDLLSLVQIGSISSTEKGIIPQSNNR